MLRLLCCTLVLTVVTAETRWEAAKLVSGFLGLDKQREAAAPTLKQNATKCLATGVGDRSLS